MNPTSMFSYYFWLGLRNLRRNPILTALIIFTLAIGVAASVSTLTILHVMSGNPIPHKSDRLLVPVLDNAPLEGYVPGEPAENDQLTYKDVKNLLASQQGSKRVALYGIVVNIEPTRADLNVTQVSGLAVSNAYFSMFEVPMAQGRGWTENEEKNAARVVVLSTAQSEKLFGKESAIGKHLRIDGNDYEVIGVIGKWNPIPRYTHLVIGDGEGDGFAGDNNLYMPFITTIANKIGAFGKQRCASEIGPGYQGFLDSECQWMQFWFEVNSASERAELNHFLDSYLAEQKKLGRFQRPVPSQLFNVMEWMSYLHIVKDDAKLSVWLAFGFLLLCLVNTSGLLLAKFSKRAAEVGVRRALGASRAEIFKQFLIETGVVGLAGGVTGLLLSFAGLWLISLQSKEMATLAKMDFTMLAVTFLLAVSASILAGLLPTWRACQVTPAIQLKSQ
jgi:putative ABC transport system permease protein